MQIVGGDGKPLTAYQQTYHWRNKNCTPFAKEWIKTNLPGVKVDDSASGSAEIKQATSVTGDCDLGQRKGKLLTIYDLEVELAWEGKGEDGEEVRGTIKIPEVSHEAIDGLSDYVFNFTVTSTSTPASEALLKHIKTAFPPLLTSKFNAFRPALIEAHGQPSSSAESPSASGASTPLPATSAASGSYKPAPPGETKAETPAKEEKKAGSSLVGDTKTVVADAELRISAADLWGLLTEESKIPMWSRSAAQIKLDADSPYSLFGGNVTGKIVSVDAPNKLVQTWQPKMPNWPSDHYATLTLTLVQGADSTKATFSLDGVPVGSQADIEKALDGFYIRGLKQMGLGTML